MLNSPALLSRSARILAETCLATSGDASDESREDGEGQEAIWTHELPLLDQLRSVELSHDGFEDLVSDGREDTLIVVLSKIL